MVQHNQSNLFETLARCAAQTNFQLIFPLFERKLKNKSTQKWKIFILTVNPQVNTEVFYKSHSSLASDFVVYFHLLPVFYTKVICKTFQQLYLELQNFAALIAIIISWLELYQVCEGFRTTEGIDHAQSFLLLISLMQMLHIEITLPNNHQCRTECEYQTDCVTVICHFFLTTDYFEIVPWVTKQLDKHSHQHYQKVVVFSVVETGKNKCRCTVHLWDLIWNITCISHHPCS